MVGFMRTKQNEHRHLLMKLEIIPRTMGDKHVDVVKRLADPWFCGRDVEQAKQDGQGSKKSVYSTSVDDCVAPN